MDDSGETDEVGHANSRPDHIIFLIDASESMFELNEEGNSQIMSCLRVAEAVTRNKIISSEKIVLV